MNIVVLGLWHLGSVTAAALAEAGHDVIGIDFNDEVITSFRNGKPPVFEPGLEAMIAKGLASGRLRFSSSVGDIPPETELVWVTYDTPVDEDDVADVPYVFDQVARALPSIPSAATVLVSSQLPVGSTRALEARTALDHPGKRLTFAISPENLRLGGAIAAFMTPDRVVVGVSHDTDRTRITEMLAPITDRIEWMSVESAEMAKHAINAFLATSVVFANEIASVCEAVGADAKEVERALKTERRIGPRAYLSPGGAFAGGTLARDIAYLETLGAARGLVIPVLAAVKVSNDHHKGWAQRKLQALLPTLAGVRVAVWGLTYKSDTDTLRRSLAVELCDWLLAQGAVVHVHDARARQLPAAWDGRVERFGTPEGALEGAAVLVLGTESAEYRLVDPACFADASPPLIVLDANRYLADLMAGRALYHVAVGTPNA